MTKEIHGSPTSGTCGGCNITFAFLDYHWPHCPNNPDNLTGATRKAIESKFTKAELAQIKNEGKTQGRRRRKKVRA